MSHDLRTPLATIRAVVSDLGHATAERHQVTVAGRPVDLTPKEFGYLVVLARQPGSVLTHRKILQEVWGDAYGTEVQYLRVCAGQLRKKLAGLPAPKLVTEPGIDERLVDPADNDVIGPTT